MPRLTLNGFYNYDNGLFDEVVLPEGIDKDIMIREIIKRGDLYTYHQSLPALKRNITDWFSRRFFDFQMLFDALHAEYNPVENYDRKESIRREQARTGSDTTTGINTADTSSTMSHNENLTDNTLNTDSSSAYNDSNFSPVSQVNAAKNASNVSNDSTGSNARSSTEAVTTYGSGNTETEENRIHGNIGVLTNQAMIKEEINLRANFDLYKVIADQFESEFLIQVY